MAFSHTCPELTWIWGIDPSDLVKSDDWNGLKEKIKRSNTKANNHVDTLALQGSSVRREVSAVKLNVGWKLGESILEIQIHNMLKERKK